MALFFVLLAVLIFGLLITVHELGHFISAKLFGIRVNEFSICMGPAIFQKKVGDTLYALRCIPIGGYCAMEGEDEVSDDPAAFCSAKPWKRIIVLAAGSVCNFIAGFLILAVMFSAVAGFTTPTVSGFFEGCPLQSYLQEGDTIHSIDGRRVYLYSDINMLLARGDGVYDLTVKRQGKLVELQDLTVKKQAYDRNGETVVRYGLLFGYEDKTVGTVLKQSWYSCVDFARIVWMSLSDLVSGLVKVEDMSGPVGIVSTIVEVGQEAESAGLAAINISYLAAFIAVNLAVMNLLPIPALDGGRIFFLVVTAVLEKLLRRKIDPKYEGYIHAAGMVLLLAFIAYVTLKDIWKLFV